MEEDDVPAGSICGRRIRGDFKTNPVVVGGGLLKRVVAAVVVGRVVDEVEVDAPSGLLCFEGEGRDGGGGDAGVAP